MRSFLRDLGATLALVTLCACGNGNGTGPEPLPEPFISVQVTGAIADSTQSTAPRISRYGAVIDQYEFSLSADVRHGWYQEIHIWGEGPLPGVGTYALTPWRQGQAGKRMHAMFSRDVPGGSASYHAVSGTLRITRSGPEGITGEFTFHGVPGFLMPNEAVLSPQLPAIDVQGSFSARCEGLELCR
jgi:hypothetical protein